MNGIHFDKPLIKTVVSHENFGRLELIFLSGKTEPVFLINNLQVFLQHTNLSIMIRRNLTDMEDYFTVDKENFQAVKGFLIKVRVIGKRANRACLFITVSGLQKIVSLRNLPNKIDLCNWLKEKGVFKEDKNYVNVRKEIEFIDILKNFLLCSGVRSILQHIITPYRLDMFIPEYNICIEYDEIAHNNRKQQDTERDKYLEKMGIQTIRIKEDKNIGKILHEVLRQLVSKTSI